MKLTSTIFVVFVLMTKISFGQSDVKTVETFEKKVIIRPFFVRWLRQVSGTNFGQVEKLELKNDGTFHYSYRDLYCGFTNHDATGTWTKDKNRLILNSKEEGYIPWNYLIIDKRKLFVSTDSLNNGTWLMRKRLL